MPPRARRFACLAIVAPCLLDGALVEAWPMAFLAAESDAGAQQGVLPIALFSLSVSVFLLLALLLYSHRRMARHLERLTQAVQQIATGDCDAVLPHRTKDEISRLIGAIEEMRSGAKQREHRLHENEMRLTAIIDHSASALITLDGTGTLRSFNKAAEQIFGYTEDEVIGENIRILLPTPDQLEHDIYAPRYRKPAAKKILGSGIKKIIHPGRETRGQRKNGEVFPLFLAMSEVTINDEELLVGSLLDISQQKLADAELTRHRDNLRAMIHDRTKDLKIAMERAEAANRAKSNFISNMSHEIRTPMNALLGFLALALESKMLPDELRETLAIAHRSAWSLLGILDDILDISKLEGARMALEQAPFNLSHLLRDITRTLELTARQKGLFLRLTVGQPLPEICAGDPMRLRQVLFNLLSNAVKFTATGGVTLHAAPLKGSEIHFSITDTGIGIAKSQLTHLFEPFSQGDTSTTRRHGGTGLGTSIAKQLVELMGGTIWVESKVGKGSTFHVVLHLPEAKGAPPVTEPTPLAAAIPRGLSILVAEDIAENAKLIMIRLAQQGHEATAATNGRETLHALSKKRFDLILMDVHMPEMDGLEATQSIRSGEIGEALRQIPIIGLTASAGRQDVAECLDAGMNQVVTKPIDFAHLYATMRTVMALPDPSPVTPPPLPATGWPRFDGIDTTRAMTTWQDPELFVQSLSSFVRKFMDTPRAMLRQLEKERAATLHERVHAITGAAANLCITEIHNTCTTLTPLLFMGDTEAIRPLLTTLDNAFQRLSMAIPPEPDGAPPAASPRLSVPNEELRVWFHKLLTSLESDNPDRVIPLLTPPDACLSPEEIRPILRKVNLFDFRGAEAEARKAAESMNIILNGETAGGET